MPPAAIAVAGGLAAGAGGAVASKVLGGGGSSSQGSVTPMTAEERKRLQDIEAQIQAMSPETQNAITNMFQQDLTKFLAGGSQNPNPTAEQLQQATAFVDQTFTNPSQSALADYQSQAQGRAAALGRNPNADTATQQAIAQAGMGLQAERGSRIAQASRELNDIGYNRNLQNLQTGMSGSNFLNQLGQQAFTNRLGLLNQRSGLADFYQRERGVQGYQSNASPLSQLASGMSNVGSIVSGGQKLGGLLGIGGGVGSDLPKPGEYRSSENG